jgi:hypothetical protein
MLVQQFGGALLALLVAGAFGFAAAKAGTIGLGLFRRSIPFRALLELFQIDGFPHDHFHHPNGWYRGAIPRQRKFSRMARVNPVFIMKIPVASKSKNHISLCESGIFLCSNTAKHNNGRLTSLSLSEV